MKINKNNLAEKLTDSKFNMIKNLILAVVLLAVGYVAAVFVPMPADIKNDLLGLVTSAESKANDAEQSIEMSVADEKSNVAGGKDTDTPEKSTQVKDPNKVYFTQADLLFKHSSDKATLFLGTFPTEAVANEEIDSLILSEQRYKFDFILPTSSVATLVTIGQYDTENEAMKAKNEIEAKHDINLMIVKFPTPEPPPSKPDEEIVDTVIEALQASKK